MALPLTYSIYYSEHLWVAVLGSLVFISDYADGYFARKYNEISETGKVLDPLADKAVVIGAVIALLLTDRTPLWFVVAVAARDLLIILGGIILRKRLKGFTPPSNMIGKITINVLTLVFFLQYLQIEYSYVWGSVLGLLFLVVSFIFYLARTWRYIRSES